jgi:hypothetical protein
VVAEIVFVEIVEVVEIQVLEIVEIQVEVVAAVDPSLQKWLEIPIIQSSRIQFCFKTEGFLIYNCKNVLTNSIFHIYVNNLLIFFQENDDRFLRRDAMVTL